MAEHQKFRAHMTPEDHQDVNLRFAERAPEIRHERTFIIAAAGYMASLEIILIMLVSLTPFAPDAFGTAVGDGTFSANEQWFAGILAGAVLLAVMFGRNLLAPFYGIVELRFRPSRDELSIIHDVRCVNTLSVLSISALKHLC